MVMAWMVTPVFAVSAVNWIAPANGTTFPVGTLVAPTGVASGIGTTGEGLDLALVLDSSASMTALVNVDGVIQTRAQWQKDAAIALLESLPTANVAVTVVEFDYYSSLVRWLSPLSTEKDAILAAIDAVDASGSTFIGKGIDVATAELTGVNHTAEWVQQMVVFSDGYTAGVPADNVAAAVTAGVDAVHSIALPGADLATMESIAIAGNGTFIDASTPAGLQQLIERFSGQGGSLVGIDHVDISMPDGSFVGSIAVDALGHFTTPEWLMQLGTNTFMATAYAIDGTSASAPLSLYGVAQVAEPDMLPLLGLGLFGLIGLRRRKG
jgi:hypothetical protein